MASVGTWDIVESENDGDITDEEIIENFTSLFEYWTKLTTKHWVRASTRIHLLEEKTKCPKHSEAHPVNQNPVQKLSGIVSIAKRKSIFDPIVKAIWEGKEKI
ncbi:hypothetical protein LIER_38816 [Lithospermum erythrorhizon]|uniref:Uncharacterized protein n=1 Tax=Lithospermum erythrorhizon TaxID=34254 RepID=A0AAV3Q531_LITER